MEVKTAIAAMANCSMEIDKNRKILFADASGASR